MDDVFDAGFQHVNFAEAIRFFHEKVKAQVREKNLKVPSGEKLYVASILANYAQVSCSDSPDLSPTLLGVFDHIVVPSFFATSTFPEMLDSGTLEVGGSQTLFLTGFFQDQLRRRHNIKWYVGLGTSFYSRAGLMSKDPRRQEFFDGMSRRFGMWVQVYNDLSKMFQYSWVPSVGGHSPNH